MTTILGIDESGRGPVLGPLIIAGVMINETDEQKLIEIEVKDSKLLENNRREVLFDKIINVAKTTRIINIEPLEIDNAVLSKENMNLNWLEANKSAKIINEFKPEVVILDCPHPIPKKYEDYVRNLLDNPDINIICEHKADTNYPTCSAASILAKVTREREMDKIKQKYGETGPGYPSNKTTQEFIKSNFEKHPEIFRKSWKTFQNLVKNKSQKKLKQFR